MMTSFITEKGTRHSFFSLWKGCVVRRLSLITGVNPSVAQIVTVHELTLTLVWKVWAVDVIVLDVASRCLLKHLMAWLNLCLMWVNHSGQIQARNDDTITKILYLIYTVWHLATPFLVFFSFLDSTMSGHVTQISTGFIRGCQIL